MSHARRASLTGALLALLVVLTVSAVARQHARPHASVHHPATATATPKRKHPPARRAGHAQVRDSVAGGSATHGIHFAFAPDTTPADTVGEPVIVELRIGRIARATVQGYRVRTEVLLPLSQFLQLVEIRHRLSPEGKLEAVVDPGNRRIVIDVRRDTMQFGDRLVRIEPEFRRFESGDLYVGAERLGDLLGLRFAVDWADLTVTVIDPWDLRRGADTRPAPLRAAGAARSEAPRGR